MGLSNEILSIIFLALLCPGNVFAESITFEILRLRLLATTYYNGTLQGINLQVSPTDERWDLDFSVTATTFWKNHDSHVCILRKRIHDL